MTREVRIPLPPAIAWRHLEQLGLHRHIIGAHRRPHGRHPNGTLHLLIDVPTRWTCASCGASFAGPLCPNCNGAAS